MITSLPPTPPAYVKQVEDDCISGLSGHTPKSFVEIKKRDYGFTVTERIERWTVKVACSLESGNIVYATNPPQIDHGPGMDIDSVETTIEQSVGFPHGMYFTGS